MRWLRSLEDPGPWPRKLLRGHLATFLVWVTGVAFALALPPNPAGHGTHQALGLPPCPLVLAQGKPCPGCGLTTSASHLARLDVAAAWNAHPVGVVLFVGFSAYALWSLSAFLRGVRIRSESRTVTALSALVVAAILAFGVWRYATSEDYATLQERLLPLLR